MSRVEIERRIAEIQAEENEMAERQYRYGYMIDRQYSAKLFQEKMKLMKQLKCRWNYCVIGIYGGNTYGEIEEVRIFGLYNWKSDERENCNSSIRKSKI